MAEERHEKIELRVQKKGEHGQQVGDSKEDKESSLDVFVSGVMY